MICGQCAGSGRYVYATSATWKGAPGAERFTEDVCSSCWGSGNEMRPGMNLRSLLDEVREYRLLFQCLEVSLAETEKNFSVGGRRPEFPTSRRTVTCDEEVSELVEDAYYSGRLATVDDIRNSLKEVEALLEDLKSDERGDRLPTMKIRKCDLPIRFDEDSKKQ